jgi:hypothetical protein
MRPEPGLYQNVPSFNPIGQEFVPSFAALDVVELYIWEQQNTPNAIVRVAIRDDTINGDVVGESGNVPLPAGFRGAAWAASGRLGLPDRRRHHVRANAAARRA